MRTFIGIEIDEIVRERLTGLQRALKMSFPSLRGTNPRQIHLTLKFLGEIEERQVAGVRKALDDVAASTKIFAIDIRQPGVFPMSGAPRTVWIGVHDPDGSLARCHAAVEATLATLGFPREDRPFSPHLTLARCPDRRAAYEVRRALSRHENFDAGGLIVRRIVLFQSTLTSSGPIYEPISTHHLQHGNV